MRNGAQRADALGDHEQIQVAIGDAHIAHLGQVDAHHAADGAGVEDIADQRLPLDQLAIHRGAVGCFRHLGQHFHASLDVRHLTQLILALAAGGLLLR